MNRPRSSPQETIFKAYDIRGVVGSSLTEDVVFDIGCAIGSEAHEAGLGKIAVARDGRLSGPGFIEALGGGIRSSGCDVVDIGMVPTPLLYFAAATVGGGSGVMVTGSHNPPQYNGFKIVLGGETLAGDRIRRLRERIAGGDLQKAGKPGAVRRVNVVDDYIDRVCSDIDIARPLKVVADCGNGVAGIVAPRLLRSLGCEVTELYCEVDGTFPHHHPDPSQPENLTDLIAAVTAANADLGLAFDGDGDRLGVIDPAGEVIWPDRQMMLFATEVLRHAPGAPVIFDVKCSRHLERLIREHGGLPVMSRTGHSLIKARLKELDAPLAGEMSGHIFFRDRWYGFDDALYAAARLIELLSRDQRRPSEIFAALPNSVSTPELRVDFADEGENHRFMERFLADPRFTGARIVDIDGLRAEFTDGWGLVRASNTTPSLILRFEADDVAALERIKAEFRTALLAIEPGLTLPF